MPINAKQLTEHDFIHTHDVLLDGNDPVFRSCHPQPPNQAGIYMWASPLPGNGDTLDVMYIGKAGYGVERRLSQHRGGFTHSATGRANRELIINWLETGRTLRVYARTSKVEAIFGAQTAIYSAEEEAACIAFEPRWNRAKFPRMPAIGAGMVAPEEQPLVEAEPINGVGEAVAAAFVEVPQGDEVVAFAQTLEPVAQAQFARIMSFIQERAPGGGQKIVHGYSHQPTGYNNTPMLTCGQIRESDGKADKWFARVPLVNTDRSPLTIILHPDLLSPAIDHALIAVGAARVWRPLDLNAFLASPENYLGLR